MKNVLVTGANGEIGHELIEKLSGYRNVNVVALDINKLDDKLANCVTKEFTGDILDFELLSRLFKKYEFDTVFHLAAMLSTSAEKDPIKAHHVNTDGSISVMSVAEKLSRYLKKQVVFIFPSSIAVYGLPSVKKAHSVGKIKEKEWNKPATMYGCNKLYIEFLGNYYEKYYRKDKSSKRPLFDFRAVRFPGLLSANTLPTGGTSDWGPEILHYAAQGKHYECFVRKDSWLPFMTMPDAVKALTMLASAPKKSLKHDVYNVGGFTVNAGEIAKIAKKAFGWDKIIYKPDIKRQAIVDSWPEDVDDTLAKKEWGFKSDYNKETAFNDYLIPAILKRYSS